jgi:hypothetical protein
MRGLGRRAGGKNGSDRRWCPMKPIQVKISVESERRKDDV